MINQIAERVSGVSLVDMRPILNELCGEKNVTFNFSPVAHFTIKTPDGDITIVNKKYTDNPDVVVGDIAIGY